eukprot:CAMPEP_0185575388 /NCGR_PEP_ID=MMETSP0434-20130131/6603_1 /TAXON_ID=626734 ORGANISM="Favella taraikaensis, Strain Fe Narragansett Bay" /NCGR_SAMPLE_ID=MMETSP0434 /ASSEMBLY_ACC=CAM_ASM_000379 /LENGTH=35 /DNA_ID= /DNA_START= /DNA_END= /DNA_ORIENTATION=
MSATVAVPNAIEYKQDDDTGADITPSGRGPAKGKP